MSSEPLKSDAKLLESFRRTLAAGRMAHAYIFYGPLGVGKRELALDLARMLLCPDRGCARCPVCRRVTTGNHADFRFVARDEADTELKIEKIRELQAEVHLHPMEGMNKVFIINECHLMSEEAANCLLKTLEEPPEKSYLFLLTELPEALPATIRSRCQEARVPPKSTDEVASALTSAYSLQEADARYLARLSEGCLGQARNLHEKDAMERSRWLFERLRSLNEQNELGVAAELEARIHRGKAILEEQREEFRGYVDLAITFFRDMLSRSLGLPEDRFYHTDSDSLAFYGEQRMASARAISAIELCFRAKEWTRRNANMGLVVENFVVELRQFLSSDQTCPNR
jgi:DNA polymerase-3 subunit delta'